MLDDYFVRNGYEVIHPECISLIDLIIKICSAKYCASESGSIAHNFLFCHSTQDTVIIERQTVINDAQTSIDRVRRLQTKYVDGHLTISSIYTGEGPFFLCYTSCFENYTYDSGYKEPSMKYKSSTYLRKCLEDYIEMYKKIYKHNSPFIGNEERFCKSLNEAYWDTQHILETHGIEMKFKG